MNEQIDLKELERKAYRSFFQDGLLDIGFGWIIIGMSLSSFLPLFGILETFSIVLMNLIWNSFAVVLIIVGKKRITMRRLGRVKFGLKRQAEKKKLTIFMTIMVIATMIMVLLTATGILQAFLIKSLFIPLFLGLMFISIPFFLMAYFIDFSRLYYYGLGLGLSLFIADLLNPFTGTPLDAIIVYWGMGILIVIIGIFSLVHFLKKYPLLKEVIEQNE